jgi:hypothetical protein
MRSSKPNKSRTKRRDATAMSDMERFNAAQRRQCSLEHPVAADVLDLIKSLRHDHPRGLSQIRALRGMAKKFDVPYGLIWDVHMAHRAERLSEHHAGLGRAYAKEKQARRVTREAFDRLEAKGLIRKTGEFRSGQPVYVATRQQ